MASRLAFTIHVNDSYLNWKSWLTSKSCFLRWNMF